ncbi:hypothetical protein JHK82_022660 [Glycine max]|nr:hypothetical protein JHK85_023148 [Glycine max]KAG5137929.1 hypothetical protein JHK82_022660 [Glycine max]
MSQLGVENGGVAPVITEDSDLIAYGYPAFYDRPKSAFHFPSPGKCVLAACDFLPSVPGVGIA